MNQTTAANPGSEDPGFLRAVADLAVQRPVVTTRAIYNAQGVKLLEGGVTVDAGLYDRLLSHRLAAPLDESLASHEPVDGVALVEAAQAALERWPFFALMGPAGRMRGMLLEAIKAIPLPRPIAFHLSLARQTRPALFDHGVLMAMLCAHLTREGGESLHDMTIAAAAGLLHDLGMLHIDPELLDGGKRLSGDQRRPLYAHPVTSSMLIERFQAYPQKVSRAILEHHEQLDGSGYPRGLAFDAISPLGRLLSLAEVVTAMFDGDRKYPEQRVSLLLRMSPYRYDPALVPSIHRLLAALPAPQGDAEIDTAEAIDRLRIHAELLDRWRAATEQIAPELDAGRVAMLHSVSEQADALQRMLCEAGITPDQLGMVSEHAAENAASRVELWAMAQELQWHLRAIANQLQRRWRASAGAGAGAPPYPAALAVWFDDVSALDLPG